MKHNRRVNPLKGLTENLNFSLNNLGVEERFRDLGLETVDKKLDIKLSLTRIGPDVNFSSS